MSNRLKNILILAASVWAGSFTPMLADFHYATRGLEQMAAVLSIADSLAQSDLDLEKIPDDGIIIYYSRLPMHPALESVSNIDGEVSDAIKMLKNKEGDKNKQGIKRTEYPVKVRIKKSGRIEHIGYDIFKFADPLNQPVMDFVERYSLDLELPIQRNRSLSTRLAEDGIQFEAGDFSKLKTMAVDTTLQVIIRSENNRSYTVQWNDNSGNTKLKMSFPIKYELLLGANLLELEHSMVKDIENAAPKFSDELKVVDSLSLENRFYPDFYVLPGETTFINDINSDRYYHRIADDEYALTYTPKYPIESVANILLGNDIAHDHMANVKVVTYSGTDSIRVPLAQVVEAMTRSGFKSYCGLLNIDHTTVKMMCFYRNDKLGMGHMVRYTADLRNFPSQPTEFEARIMPYIPTNKILNLFGNTNDDNIQKEPKPFGTLDFDLPADDDLDNGSDQGRD